MWSLWCTQKAASDMLPLATWMHIHIFYLKVFTFKEQNNYSQRESDIESNISESDIALTQWSHVWNQFSFMIIKQHWNDSIVKYIYHIGQIFITFTPVNFSISTSASLMSVILTAVIPKLSADCTLSSLTSIQIAWNRIQNKVSMFILEMQWWMGMIITERAKFNIYQKTFTEKQGAALEIKCVCSVSSL